MTAAHQGVAPTIAAGTVGAVAAAWLVAHGTAPAVRAWTVGTADVRRSAGRCASNHTSRRDTPRTATLLLPGLMTSSDVFGAAYYARTDDGPLLMPDLHAE